MMGLNGWLYGFLKPKTLSFGSPVVTTRCRTMSRQYSSKVNNKYSIAYSCSIRIHGCVCVYTHIAAVASDTGLGSGAPGTWGYGRVQVYTAVSGY